ncbi:MAG: YlxR family protein [Chloroflexi bacterium]|nr:YlxR family protein [Chloroflexota bacterium]
MPKNRHVPERSCVACGSKVAKAQLNRVVKTAQGSIIVDTTGREPGRGAYLCHLPDCWDKAIHKGALQRGFKQDLSDKELEPIRIFYEENIASRATAP